MNAALDGTAEAYWHNAAGHGSFSHIAKGGPLQYECLWYSTLVQYLFKNYIGFHLTSAYISNIKTQTNCSPLCCRIDLCSKRHRCLRYCWLLLTVFIYIWVISHAAFLLYKIRNEGIRYQRFLVAVLAIIQLLLLFWGSLLVYSFWPFHVHKFL